MEPKTISAGEYFANRAQPLTARARALDESTQSAGETAAPRTTARDDNMSDDCEMSSPKKTEIGDANAGSPMEEEKHDDSSLSSQPKKTLTEFSLPGTPPVDYGESDDASDHGAKEDEAKATSQSPALSFSPSFAGTVSPYSLPYSLAEGSVKEEGEVEETHLDRHDRDEEVITNATEESEARATYSTVEYQPWLPSSWVLERLDGLNLVALGLERMGELLAYRSLRIHHESLQVRRRVSELVCRCHDSNP